MSSPFWIQDNGRWLIATSKDFELPPDRIVSVLTKGRGYKRLKLATEHSCASIDKFGKPILLWGFSDLSNAHGKRIKRSSGRKGLMS